MEAQAAGQAQQPTECLANAHHFVQIEGREAEFICVQCGKTIKVAKGEGQ